INNNKGVLDVSTQDALIEVSAGQQLSVGSVQLIIKSFSQGKMVFASVPGVCSQGPGVSQTKECGPGNCGLCSENQCLNLEALKECSPVYDVGKRDNKVSIQDVGGFKLDPSTITIIQGESIEFKNDGVKTHSLLIQETSSRIELGVGSIKPQSFNSPGTYTYCETTSSKCDSASVKGTITVVKKSSSGNQFLYCSVFDPNKKPPVELAQCDNPNDFDFGALLERRIALAQADQLLNPNKASRAVASSASNQVLLSFGQWVPQAFGAGCQQSSDGIVCNKQVTPLVPRNGVAVSISNQLGTDTQIDASLQGNSQCFTISNVEQRNTLDQFISGVQEGVSGALGLPQNQYRTYVISYDASKPNCGTWSIDSEGIVSLTANAQAKVRISSFSVAQLPPFVVTINIQGGAQSELAFKAMPLTVIQRGEMTEPFFFTNNLKTKITVNNKDVLVNTVTYSELDPTKPINVKIGSSEEKLSIDYDNPGSNAFDAIGYDVVGNLADSADCGDKDYCNPEQLSEYSSSIASQINTEVSPIYASMDRVKFGGLVTSSQDAFSKAFDDAQREFLASQQTYLACKALGVDPVAKLREKCDSVLTTPQDVYSGQLGSIYGDVFRQASCDSEFVNSFQALYGGGFNWNSYKQRLIGFASFQKSGYVDYGKPILANEDLVIRVPVKLAGRNGGISFLQFKTNANSLSYYGDSAIDDASWNRIDDISGSVGVPNLLDFVNGFSVSGTSGASIKSFQGTHFYVDGTNLLSSSSNAPTLFTVNKYAFSEPSETASNEVRQIAEYFKAGSFKESNPITILYSEENIPNNAQGAIALDVTKNTLTVYSRGTDSQPFAFQLAKYFADESYDFDSIPAGCSFEHVSENVIVFNNCVTSKEKTPEPVIEPKEPEIQVPSATSYQVEVKCGLPIAGTGDSRILSVKASTLAGTCPDTFSGTGNPGTSDAYCVYFYLSPRTFAPKNSNSLLDLAFSFRNGGIDVSSGSEWAGRTAIAVDESMLSVYRTPSRAPGYFLNLGESGSSESTTSETLYYRSVLPVNANQKQEGMKCYAKIYNLYQIAPTKFFMYLGGKELTTASGSSLGLPRRCLLGNYVSSWNPTNSLLTINEQANQVSVSTGEGCQDFVN
ncbi:hypothetical protein HUU53_03320, partial [Candidatus Micrarchaeota archaeon]|nr:hypothetical protein [Candidatus Micrarchaeota archaeon]